MCALEMRHPLWRFLASVRLLIGLLILFVLICIVGAVIPQDLKPAELVARYGPVKADWLQKLCFTYIFHSWYFVLLLLSLSVNVIACTTSRLLLKAMRGPRLIGYLLLHTSLIILFAGGTVSALGEQKGFVQIWEGRASNRFWSWNDAAWRELPFTVALDRFTVQRYEGYGTPTVLASIPEEFYTQEFPADLKQTFRVGTDGYRVTPLRYLPDFSLDIQSGHAISRSEEPNNPALLVEIQGDRGTERRWLFARHPELQMAKDSRLKLLFRWQPIKVKQYTSEVRILESSQQVRRATISVNQPFRYRGWRIYQTSYDPQENRWSGFQVSNDPGIKIVMPGFLGLVAGVVIMLGISPFLDARTNA